MFLPVPVHDRAGDLLVGPPGLRFKSSRVAQIPVSHAAVMRYRDGLAASTCKVLLDCVLLRNDHNRDRASSSYP